VKSYIAIFNPSGEDAELSVEFYYADGAVKTLDYAPAAMSRSTIDLNQRALKNIPFGMKLSSSQPVVAQFVLFDQRRSAGYSTFGASDLIYLGEEEELDEGIAAEEEVSSELEGGPGYSLVKAEVVSASGFNPSIQRMLVNITKSQYSYDGESLLAWRFEYADGRAASEAFAAVLAGELFRLLESAPADVAGVPSYSFVADKSEGYVLQASNTVEVFVAGRGSSGLAKGLAETLVSPPPPEEGVGIGRVMMMLALLVLLAVVLRLAFRRRGRKAAGEEGEGGGGWEGMIPSARPKPRRQRSRSAKKEHGRKAEHHARKEPASGHERKEPLPKRHPVEPKDVHIREIKEHVEHPAAEEVPDAIPEYEDVFRHVNRDMDEVKPK
jgi:hypothetical protein